MEINKALFKDNTPKRPKRPKPKTITGTIKFRLAQHVKKDEEEKRVLNSWIDSIFGYRFSTGNTELIVRAIELENPEIKRRNKMKPEMMPKIKQDENK